MNRQKRRVISFLLALCTVFGCLLPNLIPMAAEADEFPNTYINTGDQRKDIIGVALTQMGYTEGPANKTKYGAWYGMANQPWCAMFICWCATQADVGTNILRRTAIADPGPGYYNIPYYDGKEYTPLPGDLFFTKDFSHVGFVYYTDGDYFYTIEGNTNVHDPDKPKPSDVEGLYVMTNRRRTKDYYFGVPAYEGGDKEHTYVKKQNSTHPHRTYYLCTTCGDKYYTGYNAFVESCSDCMPCQCSSAYSGYYLVDINTEFLNIRSGHGIDSRIVGAVIDDEVVYVHGASPSTGWAYVEYDGKRGHLYLDYLKKYYAAPAAPKLSLDKEDYVQDDGAKISWNMPKNTDSFRIEIYKDGELQLQKSMGKDRSFELTKMTPGEYEVQVYALNKTGASPAGSVKFTVRNVYRVKYSLRGGSDGPKTQVQTLGQVMNLSKTTPVRAGYTFMGWSDSKDSKFVTYEPGDSFISDKDVTLYAVWKKDGAKLKTLSIERLPVQTRYLKGDALNTSGLTLKLLYSDGSGKLTTEGFTTEGFSSDELGTKTITVTYGKKTVTYDVQVMTYIPGDINENRLVNRDDVMQLLWHISFPDKFPIAVHADFKEDGKVNRDDVMQLLWHVSFPDKFPLATVPDEEEPEPPATEPPATEPPATEPPATEPPATEPPATEPPATEPPATEPPATEPPTTEPPATEPPATEPPATEPPATEPSATEPPASEPPAETTAPAGE